MKNRFIKQVLASVLIGCLVAPVLSYVGTVFEAKAADTAVAGEIGDTNGDGKIDALELVRIKKSEQNANQRVALHFSKFTETLAHFITKSAYAAGSTVTFDVYVPANWDSAAWWGVTAIDKLNKVESSYYDTATYDKSNAVAGKWSSMTYSLPTSGGPYYIGFGGETGTSSRWAGQSLLIDNFKVTASNGSTVLMSDDFETEFENGFFSVQEKGKDLHGDGYIAVSHAYDPETVVKQKNTDLNNDGLNNEKDASLMRKYLVDEIYSFYRSDTSYISNDTAKYQVTDELNRTVKGEQDTKEGKAVGIRYFLHLGTEETNPLYSVSNILSNNANAYSSSAAWEAAGGGAVGTNHWWGESLFGYYTSMDKWVIERDVQMLTDAGIDFLAIDTTDGIYTAQLALLLEVLDKYDAQGFNVPKVTFTSDVSTSVADLKTQYSHLWYSAETIGSISNMSIVHVAENVNGSMSSSAFYGNTTNHSRDYNGRKSNSDENAVLEGYNFIWEFENAIEDGADTILIENWNEWISERTAGTDSEPIVLNENADMAHSSDIQPMSGGYGDSYYMQLIQCIQDFKGSTVANHNLNTVSKTENVSIDIDGDFKQWNKVSTHYIDYTEEIGNRDAEGYQGGAKVETNYVAELEVANLMAHTGGLNFVTKTQYPGGSKVTFRAYVPNEITGWWGAATVTNITSADIYACASNNLLDQSKLGKWETYEFTLPSDSNNYYFAIGGPPGTGSAFVGKTLLVDDFEVSLNGNVLAEDDFSTGLSGGIFNVNTSGWDYAADTSLSDVIRLKTITTTQSDQAASINLNTISSGSEFITKQVYAGGSKISFKAYIPKELQKKATEYPWWDVYCTTSLSNTDIYSNWLGGSYTVPTSAELGQWVEYEYTLPTDADAYYIYIAGEAGQWKDSDGNSLSILIEDFSITSADGELLASEDFNDISKGIFNTGASVSTVDMPITYTDTTGRNDISKMKMTLDDTYLYALVETVDDIQGFGSANCMSLFLSDKNVGHCWNNYEYVVNRDSSKASSTELIVETFKSGKWVATGRAKYRIEGNLMHMAIPLSAIGNADSFEMEFKWADNYSEDDIYSFYLNGDAAPYGRSNYVFSTVGSYAAFYVNKTVENAQSFMANGSYPGGSTISFDAYVPAGGTDEPWWGVGYGPEAERNKASIYGIAGAEGHGTGFDLKDETKRGDWKTYSVTLPSGGPYYVFISGVCNEGAWNSEPLLIDNFTVKNGDTLLVRETFANGFGIFANDAIDSTVRTIVVNENEPSIDGSAELHVGNLQQNYNKEGWNFVTADTYSAGTKFVFDAYITSDSSAGGWWGAVPTKDPDSDNIYKAAEHLLPKDKLDQWVTHEVTITEDGSYLTIGAAVGDWKNRKIYLDNFKVYNANGELIAKDNFSQGLHAGLFDITEYTDANVAVSLGMPSTTSEVVSGNNALSITKTVSEDAHVMTTSAYPAGSTITFDAYVPNGANWWGIRSTADNTKTSIYSSDGYTNYQDVSYQGDWSTYTATLPESGGPYYFYFVTESNAWAQGTVLIDNIVVRNADGQLLVQDDFNDEALQDSMFTILNASAVELVPEEEDTVDVHFTAYDSPTINGVVGGAAYDKIDAAYKKLAEAGFTKALALREGSTSIQAAQNATGSTAFADYVKWRTEQLNTSATTVLDIANKYGLSYYVKDWSFYNLGREGANLGLIDSTLISAASDFKTVTDTVLGNSSAIDHPAYAGHYATDEPADSTTDFNALKYQATYYNKWMSDNGKAGELYVNLLPAYGDQDDRGWFDKWFDSSTDYKYESSYVTSYLDKYLAVATNADSKINYISWDYYPFMVDGHDAKTLREENYLYNFNVMAQAAKTNNLELRLTLQSTDEVTYGLRGITSVADMKFQIYTGMAFGVNDFTYYKYSGTNGEGIFDYETGETDETLYSYAKEANSDVHAIENCFADYKWDSVMAKQGTNTTTMSDRMISGAQLTNSDGIAHDHISSVAASQDTLCGIFTAVDTAATTRPYGYMFVNISDPANNASDTVTINFADGVKAVCVCKDGTQEIVRVSGSYTFTLETGSGAFIVPIL